MNKEQIIAKLEEIENGLAQAVNYIEQFKNSHAQLLGQKAALSWALQELEKEDGGQKELDKGSDQE